MKKILSIALTITALPWALMAENSRTVKKTPFIGIWAPATYASMTTGIYAGSQLAESIKGAHSYYTAQQDLAGLADKAQNLKDKKSPKYSLKIDRNIRQTALLQRVSAAALQSAKSTAVRGNLCLAAAISLGSAAYKAFRS
ncbi:MAG: hypothetical protein WC707_04940 [Candidatus Babeliaceae bacterium]